MKTNRSLQISLLLAGLLSLPLAFGQTLSRDEHKARESRIEANYKADKAACDSLAGNAKDVCQDEAQGKERVSKAQLKYDASGKAADMRKLAETRADAAYEVSKEKCDDLAGNTKDVCVKEAKAARTTAMADAKARDQVRDARNDASKDKNDANYDAARARCDGLAGNAKDACVTQAKARYGKT